MPGISYDESGSLAGYFGVTFLAVVLVPATWIVFKPAQKEPLKPLCNCPECRANFSQIDARKTSAHRKRFARRILPLALAWGLFAYLCYVIANAPRGVEGVVYNPFEILGLRDTSTEKEIKKHYKRLSLQFHPDKIKLAENQTMEDVETKFVELTKAYKSLTDEVTRENLAKYGNPDGPQQREDKIAIPQWVVESRNSIWVLGAYGLLLGGGIPYVVGRWWFSQRRHTRDGILNPTAEHFFYNLKDDTDFSTLITILAGALEFVPLLSGKKKGSKKERKERQSKVEELEKEIDEAKVTLNVDESPIMRKESRVMTSTAAARRARALIWAHLLRLDITDTELASELEPLLRECQPLLTAMTNIALTFNWLNTSTLCIKLQAALVQALPKSCSPLAQFPDISPSKGEELSIVHSAEGRKWLSKWIKNDKEISEKARHVVDTWPRLEVVSAEFKVTGEKAVSPSSVVNLNFKLRYVYNSTPSTTSTPAKASLPNGHLDEKVDTKRDDSVSVVEDTLSKETSAKENDTSTDEKAELIKRDATERVMDLKDEIVKAAEKAVEVGKKGKPAISKDRVFAPNGYAHAPRWPMVRKPHYHVLMGDSKLDRVIVPPIKITDIPFPRADGSPDEPREFTLTFPAPPDANLYSFVLHAISDTYLGGDVEYPMMMKVEEPTEDSGDEDDDISEPDEDTLAGQMAMMRGNKVKASPVHGDEDDSAEDEGEDGSEYESSSDEEGPKKKRAINEDSDSDDD